MWDTYIPNTLSGVELKTFLNKKRIIKYLYRYDTMSGSKISSLLKVSAPTSNQYLNELITEGYIELKGKGESIGGRRPNVYGLKKNSVFILGVDVGRRFLRIALFNTSLEKIGEVDLPAISFDEQQLLIDTVYSESVKLLKTHEISEKKIMGIGLNMPGLVDSKSGISYTYFYNENETFVEAVEKKFKRPVFIENDSKVRALAEMKYGAARNTKNALVIQIDWGLGLGMILDGKLYKGNSGFSGEFSHIQTEEDGVLCNCGKVGCLETVASCSALIRFAKEGLENNKMSKLYKYYKSDNLTPTKIIEEALSGDQFALYLIQKVGVNLGKGISYLIQILNPEVIILSGVLSQAKQYIEVPVQQSIYKYCLPKLHDDVKIRISELGVDSGLLGSAIVVIENILENNRVI